MSYICCKNCNEGLECYFNPTKQKVKRESNQMSDKASKELILETGKCKLKCFAYPVRIYATDAGVWGDYVHGAYQDASGWQACTWNKRGFSALHTLSSYNLVPIPVTKYFNIFTDFQGATWTGFLYDTLEEAKESWKHNKVSNAELFSYCEGVVKRVASSC